LAYLGVIRDAVADSAEVVEREEDAGLGGVRQENRNGGREQKQHGPRHLLPMKAVRFHGRGPDPRRLLTR